MDLDRLKLFLHIVDSGSMSAASKAAHLTQPAISRSMKALEDHFRTRLFKRQGRGIALTAAGRALVPRARRLVALESQTTLEVSRIAQRGYWDVRIGMIDSVATFLFPRAVGSLQRQFPDLAIHLTTARTAQLLERLNAGELDLAIVAHSGLPPGRAQRLGSYRLEYYGRKNRFPTLSAVRTIEELKNFPIVQLAPQGATPGVVPDASLSHALASNVATVKALVLAGFGVGDLTSFMLTKDEARQLVRAKVPHDPHCGLFLVAAAGWTGEAETRLVSAVADSLRPLLS